MSLTAREIVEVAASLHALDMRREENGVLILTSSGLDYVTDDEVVRGWRSGASEEEIDVCD